MKKFLLFVLATLSLCLFASDYPEKSIVLYLKNGAAKIISADELAGIHTSYVSEDGSMKEAPQYQEFVDTNYNIARIPIEDIDSIVFGRTFGRNLKDGVREITADSDYIRAYENGIIYYLANTPQSLLPKPGEKVVFENMTDIFPDGLCAEVADTKRNSDEIEVSVREIAPDKVYDSYIACSGAEGYAFPDINTTEIEEIEEIEDDDDSVEKGETALSQQGARPTYNTTVFDGQHSYRMKASVNLSSPVYSYDAVRKILMAKIKLTVEADYTIDSNHPNGSKKSYSTNNEIIIPLTGKNSDSREVFKSSLKLKTIFKTKNESGRIDSKIHRKYAVTFHIYANGDDVLVYNPDITPLGDAKVDFNEDSYVNGSVSLMNIFTLDVRNIYNRTGVRAMVTTGPTISGFIGASELEAMSAEHKKDLYEKAYNKLSFTASLTGFKTTYRNGKVEKAEKITVTGIDYKSTASHSDGDFYFLPQFYHLYNSISSSSYTLETKSFTKLSRAVKAGCEVYDKRDMSSCEKKLEGYTFAANADSHEYNFEGIISPSLGAAQISHKSVHPLLHYAGYIIKGPDSSPMECGKDGTSHPHSVDLGLPSGTQWACCNVGAASPVGYGGGFTFYSDFHDDTWDSTWSKPTIAQVRELVSMCKWVETELNGVAGWKIYGLNGNSIFLPKSGFLSDDFDANGKRLDAGKCCYIWTATGYGNSGVHCRFLSLESLAEFDSSNWYIEDPDPVTDFCALRLVKN